MSTETVSAEAAEKAAEVVEDAVEEFVDVVEVVRNNPVVLSIVGVLGLAAGAAGGYFVARKLLREHYAEIAEQEIAQAKEWYSSLNKVTVDGDPLSPQEILAQKDPEALAALREYQGVERITDVEVEAPVAEEEELLERRVSQAAETEPDIEQKKDNETINVFVDRNFDFAEEKKLRSKDRPYIITHGEWFGAEFEDFDSIELTYFADDVLVDENDKIVEDINGTIGDESLARFGHGSKDNNVVFVRNEKLQCEYEVTRTDQTYLEALGLGPEPDNTELRHSADRRRAFRNGDG